MKNSNSSAQLNYYTLRDAQKLHFMQFRTAGLGIFAHSVRKHLAGSWQAELLPTRSNALRIA